MSGLIGNAVRRRLEGKYELTALNRRSVEGIETFRADIGELNRILPAFRGVDTVVHLAGVIRATWADYLRSNIVGTYNVLEASRSAGVRRVIIASSGATMRGWENELPYAVMIRGEYAKAPKTWTKLTHESVTRPTNTYGATKVWAEAIGRAFASTYDLSVICLRIGAVNREDMPTEQRHLAVWCSQRDVAAMVERCIEAPSSVKYDIFFVTSKSRWALRDLDHARQVVGFVPKDTAKFRIDRR